jgi:phosphoesterase RecJ-like protein
MSSPQTIQRTTTSADFAAVADELRRRDRFLVSSHENPDGDALGSLLALHLALEQLGKDSAMYLAGDAPLPSEYRFMPLDALRRELPDDAGERALVAVDCANESRLGPDPEILVNVPFVVNIDHHHDNSRFGNVNLIVPDASSTGEVLADLFELLGVDLTTDIAEALYIAVVTDTGRFQYTNTSPKAMRLAATLIERGADVHRVFQGVYESVEFAKLKLLARALDHAQVFEGGRVVVSYLDSDDFSAVSAPEPYAEGIIDYLRAVQGADMSVLIREPPRRGGPARRVSLRASVDELDVSAIARKSGGGGHRQAAGFSSEESVEKITLFVLEEFRQMRSVAAGEGARLGGA